METPRITLDEKLKVQYCIPDWLRDEQIRVNNAKVKGRIERANEIQKEPIALVNFGPSLKETWEKIREFKVVMSCSGAHKFLVDRGIIPTYHLDVDPREHKIKLLGEPQKQTQYLIASTCHPKLLDHLNGFDVKLWHIFDTTAEGIRLLPAGEWAITGGCSVGVRTMTVARVLGFTEQHIFGMDGCIGKEGSHAADHPNPPKGHFVLEYPEGSGITYHTTPAMLEAAKNTWHELDMMKDVNPTFYGEGLVQEMAKRYQRKPIKHQAMIAVAKEELITTEYRELNRRLHEENLAYGVGGGKHAETVRKLAEHLTKYSKMVSVLDYGCGKGYLQKALGFPIAEYDPAIPGKEESPRPADLVCCLDVLEHVEPAKLHYVLSDLQRCIKRIGFFVIHTGPASKTLGDGRNAHLIQKGPKWWFKVLSKYFVVAENSLNYNQPPLLFVTVGARKAKPNENYDLSWMGPEGNGGLRSGEGINPAADSAGTVRSDPAQADGPAEADPADRKEGQAAMVPH